MEDKRKVNLAEANLFGRRDDLEVAFKDAISMIDEPEVVDLHYPVNHYHTKISSLNFDKTPSIEAELLGIKGQYLILDQGVLNVRKFSGYELSIECLDS